MTAHQKLQQLRSAAREFTVETLKSVSGQKPSPAMVARVARQLVDTLRPVIRDDQDRTGQANK